jgi:hypothetical protein
MVAYLSTNATPEELTSSRVRELLSYDPLTGVFVWKRGRAKGQEAGWRHGKGYRTIRVDRRSYLAHRLAWLFVTGEWPTQIDHINGDRADNRIENLREATPTQNMCNRKEGWGVSGFKGVVRNKTGHKWVAQIRFQNTLHRLGTFASREAAHEAYKAAAAKMHGEFASW